MNLTEQQAISIAKKVLKDIGFWSETVKFNKAMPFEGEDLVKYSMEKPIWKVSFKHGSEESLNRPKIFITIDDATGRVHPALSKKHSPIFTRYDEEEDKYYIISREEFLKSRGIVEE